MNFNRYHVSKNLFDPNSTRYHMGKGTNNKIDSVANGAMFYIKAEPNTAYTIKNHTTDSTFIRLYLSNAPIVENVRESYNVISESETTTNPEVTISNTDYAYLWIQTGGTWYTEHGGTSIMLNEGSTALPHEPYGDTWTDIPHYIMGTDTDTITTPADIYANDTTATIGLKGNMEQSGTPTPTTPIQPQECGDLETEGTKAGQYKIPILSNSTTTNVYLGEVQTTRKIKKLVLDGTENWLVESETNGLFTLPNVIPLIQYNNQLCTHFSLASSYANFYNTDLTFAVVTRPCILIHYNACQTVRAFKAFLASEYAAGHPVTIWYVLPTPQTAVVNEPLRKIGDYADEVSGITIPTIAGANTISVGTTLQPSEVTVNYKGWHPVADVHEYDSNYNTIATMQALTIAQLQTHTISDLQGGEWS